MKRMIPSEGKLSKEAKECMQECVTEFLLFITSEASERCALVHLTPNIHTDGINNQHAFRRNARL